MPFYLLGLLGQRAPEFSACFTWVCRISLSKKQNKTNQMEKDKM
jgi:hypothetical protein